MVDTVMIFIIEHKVQYYCLCPVNPLSLFQYLLHVCTLNTINLILPHLRPC